MVSIPGLLQRLLDLVGSSDDYFVSGSLSFLPLLPGYREPGHDVDVALSRDLYESCRARFAAGERPAVLRFRDVAVAAESAFAAVLPFRTGFVHVDTPVGLLDLATYRRAAEGLDFRLGAGLGLRLGAWILAEVRELEWAGMRYRAGPVELAFLPKAAWYVRARRSGGGRAGKHLEDLRRLVPLVRWEVVGRILAERPFRWRGRPVPMSLDPVPAAAVLSLRNELG